nr:MAG TPA: hypothetical protein [Caudoviricetes sp.]
MCTRRAFLRRSCPAAPSGKHSYQLGSRTGVSGRRVYPPSIPSPELPRRT